jgi:hypothetical protein
MSDKAEKILEAILEQAVEQTALQRKIVEKIEDLHVEFVKRMPCGERTAEEMRENMEKVLQSFEGTPFSSIFKGMMGGPRGK